MVASVTVNTKQRIVIYEDIF